MSELSAFMMKHTRNMVPAQESSPRYVLMEIHNQIDHFVIEGRQVQLPRRRVLDVSTFRGPTIDSDRYLVAA